MEDAYTLPCPSSLIGIYKGSNLSNFQVWPIKNIKNKIFIVSDTKNDTMFACPLLHLNEQ